MHTEFVMTEKVTNPILMPYSTTLKPSICVTALLEL